jgi:hypothetical protein
MSAVLRVDGSLAETIRGDFQFMLECDADTRALEIERRWEWV